MGTSTAITIATMNAMNSANNHHHYDANENIMLVALLIAILVLAVLWIVFTSIRQLVRKYEYYSFVDDNIGALITIVIIGGLVLLVALTQFIYTLIK